MDQTYIGAPIKRREDFRLLTGRATFTDDITFPHMLHAAILRSPHAHARVTAIDAAKAQAIPGVVAVFTFEDITPFAKPIPIRLYPLPGLEQFLQYPLAQDRVRYVGDPVAVVVAESRYIAEDGLDAVDVTYEPLPAVTDIHVALRGDTVIHEEPGTNLAARYTIAIGDIEDAFRTAAYTRKETFKVHRHTGNPLETRGLVASYDAGRGEFSVWGPTKVTHFNRAILASFLDMPESKIHFIEPDVGGGFGIRGEFYPEDFLIPFAAMKLGRPVKWIEDRLEHLKSANHSRDVLCEVEIAAQRDGTLLGMRAQVFGDMGAYIRTHGGLVPSSTAALLTGPYRIPAYQCTVSCVLTNKMGLGTFRAPGRYESCFIRERLLDLVAADLRIDPVELRLKNFVQPTEMPYTVGRTRPDGPPTVFDSGHYASALQHALQHIDYQQLKPLQGRLQDGKYHGIGLGCFVKNTGQGPYEGARVVVSGAEKIAVYLGITSLGQGHETTMAQICADSLGVPIDSFTVFHGSTDVMPFGVGTFGSRGTVMAGNAAHLACQKLRHKALAIAGRYLELDASQLIFKHGQIYRQGAEDDPLLGLDDLVRLAGPASPYNPEKPGLEATAYFRSNQLTYSYGAHVAHVAVDPETGKIEVLRYVVVEDIGRCINPLIVHGQTVGAAVQGIGATILEELVYGENGQLLSGTFMDYLLPTSTDAPPIDSIILEEAPSPLNPLGVKGAGEGGIVATGAALANAVSHALAPLGVQVTQLPLSPDRIRGWIRERARLSQSAGT
ncbi:MAG TPA: xanthine dehydrogenase family protein molybdopterin-binding subunit [Candidatus Tectomicrobia bacterium]|nr:xanthine dehydrogenase family protein molybdopterin-binding subunit [Candidatus Tectomicrobia bacterium]